MILAKRVKKIISLMIVLGIAGLTFVSILPWISVTETTLSGEPITTYNNIASMEKSNDEQINSLAGDVQLLSICFWMLIIFGLLSFIGMILRASEKYFKLAQIIMFIGCANVIFSILVVFLNFRLIQNIESTANVSLAPLLGFSSTPIKYAHLVLITGIMALIGSISYAGLTIFFSIKSYIGQKKQQYDKKTISKQFSQKMEQKPIAKKSNLEKKKEIARRIQPIEKRFEPEEKTPLKTNIRKEYYADRKRDETIEPEKTTMQQPDVPSVPEKFHEDSSYTKKERYGKPFAEEQITKPEITSEPEKLLTSPLFEKALSSALEKIQPEIKKEKTEQKQPEQQHLLEKKITVRCSECKNVFTVEKGEFETKIECPHCGRKGIIKQ
jgi:DNA-directed RNA polymerase subunit RPC12/RpoP